MEIGCGSCQRGPIELISYLGSYLGAGKREFGAEGGIVSEGVAQVFDDWAIPFSSRTSGGVGESVLFVAR